MQAILTITVNSKTGEVEKTHREVTAAEAAKINDYVGNVYAQIIAQQFIEGLSVEREEATLCKLAAE